MNNNDNMEINFRGIVNLHSLPMSEPLLPLYEAVINSVQSISHAQISNGRIDIKIERENGLKLSTNHWETDVENICITDNGVGFTDENFNSFKTYATDLKKELGCKGVGRMIWLKAFRSVQISSVFLKDNKKFIRTFVFNAEKGVSDHLIKECDNNAVCVTTVKLLTLNPKYKSATRKKVSTIARDVLNHCFIYFVLKKVPVITVSDGDESKNLNELFSEIEKEDIKIKDFEIKDTSFKLVQCKIYNASAGAHRVFMCANERTVSCINFKGVLKGVNTRFTTERGDFIYNGYVTSQYLDANVNQERTSFNIEESNEGLFTNITKKEIEDVVLQYASEYLAEDIKKYNEKKTEKIADFVQRENPRYRVLLKHYPECINNIVMSDDNEKLELELFKQEQECRLKLKEEGRMLEKEIATCSDSDEIVEKRNQYAHKLTEIGKSTLADYILQRKLVLEILENNLELQSNLKYAKESCVHKIIFPMQKISDEIDYSAHNLWLIDEKLAYHYYLASDKKIKSMQPVDADSNREPDIAIFDSPFAFTNENEQPFRNVTIIEFKRPGRTVYSDNENPINQIYGYIEDFSQGKIKTRNGRTINATSEIRFFCYIICDLTENIRQYAKQYGFTLTPDGEGFYYYASNFNAYVEIISYAKLIQDSKKRNKILFDKLFNQ